LADKLIKEIIKKQTGIGGKDKVVVKIKEGGEQ
jgi:hypothetical protein